MNIQIQATGEALDQRTLHQYYPKQRVTADIEGGIVEKNVEGLQQQRKKRKYRKRKNKQPKQDIVYSSTGLCYVGFGGKFANANVTSYTDENLDQALSKLTTKLSKRINREEEKLEESEGDEEDSECEHLECQHLQEATDSALNLYEHFTAEYQRRSGQEVVDIGQLSRIESHGHKVAT